MKFPRNAKIFRGQLDAAPWMGVFFLLCVFLLLNSSLVFVPGVPIQLMDSGSALGREPARLVAINEKGRFVYQDQILSEEEFKKRFEQERVQGREPKRLLIHTDPRLSHELLVRLRNWARDLKVAVEMPGAPIELPSAGEFSGNSGPTLVVAVNLSGQVFFQNQIINEEALKQELRRAVLEMGSALRLVVMMDRSVPYDTTMRLSQLAREAGIKECFFAVRPRVSFNRQ